VSVHSPQYHYKGVDPETGAMLFYRCAQSESPPEPEWICVYPLPSRAQPWGADLVRFRHGNSDDHFELEPVSLGDHRKLGNLLKELATGGWKLTVRGVG